MSLNPGSLPILASDLRMFEAVGVKLTVEEFLGSPAALAALQSGRAAFAQLPAMEGIRLIVELGWSGKIFWVNQAEKTSSSAGAVMMSVPSITKVADLRGKRFGIGTEGDYWAPIIANILKLNGLRHEEVVWVKDLDPVQKAEMLLDGRIDVMLTSIQNYIGKLEGNDRVHLLAGGDELTKYRERVAQVPSFVAVASKKALTEPDVLEQITLVLFKAARLFSENPDAWVNAASKRRPDVPKEKIRKLWDFFKGDWPVNGGIETTRLEETLETLGTKKKNGHEMTRGLTINQIVAAEFERSAIEKLGRYPNRY
jgi:ABC-type nitrate/sulfonate/bicarbonate transport system substrate-binding protein